MDDLPFGGVGQIRLGAYHGEEVQVSTAHAKGVLTQARWKFSSLMIPALFGRLIDFVLNYSSSRSPSARAWRMLVVLAILGGVTRSVLAQEDPPSVSAYSPVGATALWALAQLAPSPLIATDGKHVEGGLRWQVTPILYSFGIAERPWRSFIVSPIARHSGSVELFIAPEWICCTIVNENDSLVRAGLRTYLPLIEHGEVLSWSLGAAYYHGLHDGGLAFDAGIYTLNGILGFDVAVSPKLARREVIFSLSIRYF